MSVGVLLSESFNHATMCKDSTNIIEYKADSNY